MTITTTPSADATVSTIGTGPASGTAATAGNAPAPRRSRPRLLGVDATRGVALLGMIAVHSLYEETPQGRPTLSFEIFGGRAAAAFAVLAGVGIAFMTGRRRVPWSAAPGTAAMLAARALLIGGIGLLLGADTDPALGVVILAYYALMFLLAVPVVLLPTAGVFAVGVAALAGAPALQHLLLPHVPAPTLDNPSLGYLLAHPLGQVTELALTGEYPALPWMAYICFGIVVGRLTLGSVRVAAGLLATGTAAAVTAAVASSVLLDRYGGLNHIWAAQPGSILTAPETTEMLAAGGDGTVPASTWWWLAVDRAHTSTPLDLLGTTGSAVALLGLLLLAGHLTGPVTRRVVVVLLAPLAAAGGMTLTLYTAHISFINSDYDTYSATTGYLVQVSAVLLLALGWRATAGRGPLEAFVTAVAKRARERARRRPARRVQAVERETAATG